MGQALAGALRLLLCCCLDLSKIIRWMACLCAMTRRRTHWCDTSIVKMSSCLNPPFGDFTWGEQLDQAADNCLQLADVQSALDIL